MAAIVPISVPFNKRELLARFASTSGLMRVARALGAARQQLIILAYHRVQAAATDEHWPFDIELISATPDEFRWQMQFVARQFRPVSITDVAAAATGGKPLPPRSVLVTFDDGFADNYEYAFPILQEAGVPACIFVSTDLIGTDSIFWFERVAHLILRLPENTVIEIPGGATMQVAGVSAERRMTIRKLLGQLKLLSDVDRTRFVAYLDQQFGRFADDNARALSRTLTWDEIRKMARGGVEFGSHGATHAVLSNLSASALDAELVRSRDRLAKELGVTPLAIAYPVGGRTAFNDSVVKAAAKAGFRVGMSYIPGANRLNGFDTFRLRRQHVERSTSRSFFNGMLSIPVVFR